MLGGLVDVMSCATWVEFATTHVSTSLAVNLGADHTFNCKDCAIDGCDDDDDGDNDDNDDDSLLQLS